MPKSLFVIPCYNEADRIDLAAFAAFAAANPDIDFLFVNDGSRDGTSELLHQFADRQPERFAAIDLPQNQGKAEAVRIGMLQALEQDAEYVGFLDADLATPLAECRRLQDALTRRPEMQMAIGVRLPLAGHVIERKPIRRFIGSGFARVASTLLGISIADTQCGAKLIRNNDLARFLFATPFLSRWIFDVEVFARLRVAGDRQAARSSIYELPLESWREIPGSKLKARHFLLAIGDLALIYREYFLSSRWKDRVAQEMETAAEASSPWPPAPHNVRAKTKPPHKATA
ncbi:glycosyltransferase family 2 protein [Blastopirellula sp. JC732]|uniref:dolichyl-phosphate beta-glucosyltransferase n=1 Tax=Blastopirellula sediminis TaxID=2894196 RepID=A0A9X1SI18_9BACT|nr:dolichyl-phosphate beta-glucosyltransferase [Blastopirellula sediminis]MCC9604876.1 glycosyltransferase family 2 protein [Blastopirellula sediminis]MCC9631825.1 glycosyltransferase family 2 protein [Blastopirellula sediminis]